MAGTGYLVSLRFPAKGESMFDVASIGWWRWEIATATLIWMMSAFSAGAASITVDTVSDTGTGNCTLREAIEAANTDAVVDGCTAGAGTDVIDLTGLTGTITVGATGYLITSSLTISGPGARVLRISGTGNSGQTIRADGATAVTIQDVTIADTQGVGIFSSCLIPCGDSLTLRRVRMTNCVSASAVNPAIGGAISTNCSNADLTIIDSTFDDNHVTGAAAEGGAIEWAGKHMRIVNTTFSNNSAVTRGGALVSAGTSAVLESVTFSGNASEAPDGGALATIGATTLHDTVLAGTLTGGNCYLYVPSPDFAPTPAAAPDGGYIIGSYNLSDDASCALTGTGDQENGLADLGPLADNGGPTDTHLPAVGSSLIGRGDPAGCLDATGAPLTTDQRGLPRPVGAHCDIGAVETDTIDTSTTTSTLPTTSTTTITTTTTTSTTTTLPGTPLAGTSLTLAGRAGVTRTLSMLAKSPALSTTIDPLSTGATLEIRAAGGFTSTIALPAVQWRRLGKPSKPAGFRVKPTAPVRSLIVKPGKLLRIAGGGDGFDVSLATAPDPVDLVLTFGTDRYCFRFGGTTKLKAGKRFVATAAPAPASCP